MTSTNRPNDIPRDIEDQLALYFDNQATPEVCQAIQDWLEADPANAETFAEYGYIERMIFCDQKQEDASAVFGLLEEMEAAAEADTVTLLGELPDTSNKTANLSAPELVELSGYVLRKALVSKPAIISGASLAAAAVLLLALILINPFASNAPAPIADLDTRDDTETPAPLPPAVAILTASHEARWDTPAGNVAPNTGDVLRSGQRLSLTTGFAQITTNHGAVAILEAPTTIELIDSPNALRLHAGKLVGICETESSKGFLVHTPHAQITDLGTQFGVDVSTQDKTAVQVFDGEVVLSARDRTTQDLSVVQLDSGQNRVVQSDGRIQAAESLSIFTRTMPTDAYSQAVLSDHPVLYWRFDGITDGVVANLGSEPGLVGQANGTVTPDDGIQGMGLRLDGNGQAYVQSKTALFSKVHSTYTLELWVKTDRVGYSRAATCLTRTETGQNSWTQHFTLELMGNASWLEGSMLEGSPLKDLATAQSFRAYYNGLADQGTQVPTNLWPTTPYQPDRWVMLTAVVTHQSISLYCNGELISQAQHADPLNKPVDLVLGSGIWAERDTTISDRTFTGVIDEVAVYDTAMDAQRITKRYELGIKTLRGE
jgi:hypothetical protein